MDIHLRCILYTFLSYNIFCTQIPKKVGLLYYEHFQRTCLILLMFYKIFITIFWKNIDGLKTTVEIQSC